MSKSQKHTYNWYTLCLDETKCICTLGWILWFFVHVLSYIDCLIWDCLPSSFVSEITVPLYKKKKRHLNEMLLISWFQTWFSSLMKWNWFNAPQRSQKKKLKIIENWSLIIKTGGKKIKRHKYYSLMSTKRYHRSYKSF